jgi:KUP system potassium uptake protein
MTDNQDAHPPQSAASGPSGATNDVSPGGVNGVRQEARGKRLAILSLAALGVVYGDIGTSPLYAIRECFHGEYSIAPTPENVYGVLSLVVWALIMVVCVKYLSFVLRADNRGEGGVIALTAQLIENGAPGRTTRFLIMIGLFAAALLYGDGMITPAISVLSAVEGVGVAAPALRPWVVWLTVVILVALFSLQHRGTRGVGVLFGPVTIVWFLVIAALGLRSLAAHPQILRAVNPIHGYAFLARNSFAGLLVLGAVFLVVTGAETLFADLGHFGRRPIRVAWYGLVLPSLLCNYFGQGTLLLASPEKADGLFYALAPSWALGPLVVLATAATIIASQAVISGAFSLTRQAVQLGYLPRMRIIHTSATEVGQIYIPQVNWLIMLATISLVLGFRSSSHLAAAYGVAVTGTMSIATVLFFAVARRRWGWSLWLLGPLVLVFLVIDLSFFVANFSKIAHGAWFPLVIGAGVFTVMTTWKKGRALVAERFYSKNPPLVDLVASIAQDPPPRVPGKAVFLAGTAGPSPPALLHNLKHNKVLHEDVVVLTVATADVPRVRRSDRVEVTDLGHGFWRVIARTGFMEEPNVPEILTLARKRGMTFDPTDAVFFLGRERLVPQPGARMAGWRKAVFSFLSLNALGATRYFGIPSGQVVEIGAQIDV